MPDAQACQRIALRTLRNLTQLRAEGPRIGRREIQENEAAPAFDAHRIETDRALVEPWNSAHVRSGYQVSIQIIRPLMIRAQNGSCGNDATVNCHTRRRRFVCATEPRPSMAAYIVEGP